ncbi:unnamed protein product [Cylindrotheca closterium]|uniref:G-protein coupled receptors family 1 profile domain-containing protein n=1 Tax=Cylindrotheca closterium TaxID=2856 RepID=A0AAD2PVN1_9STRA|nr:unnamed protein product [Cylindrotheca closterium]
MFGKRWTSDTTVRLYTISWDLCNETIVEPDYLDIEPDVGNNIDQKLYGVALYFDPFETTGNLECRHSTMAQVAEKKYPTAQYLLIANTDLVPITKYDEELDSTLALATVTLDDGDAIKNRFGDETVSSIATGSILVTVDATSRFILDTSITLEHIERGATTIITMTQISAFLSFIGSVYVLYTLVGNKQRRSKSMRVPFNRLLLAISIADLMSSLAMMVAGWATPTAPPGNYEGYYSNERWEVKFPRAVGNDGTCNAQAFFMHIGLAASAFFTGYVAIQTLLVVRYAWTEKQMEKAEYVFFGTGIGIPLVTGIWAGAVGLFNPMSVGFCWINEAIEECHADQAGPLLGDYCESRIAEDRLLIYQTIFAMAWIMLAMLVILFSMVSLYLFVRQNERKAARWSQNASDGRQQKRVLTKSVAIISAYFFTWTPAIVSLTPAVENVDTGVVNMIVAAILPLQGFFNALIFSGCAEHCLGRLCFGNRNSNEAPRRSSVGGEGT